ncbi:MAG TPA: hypothetical protein VE665_02750, partial [Hyphomicrobiaceae bacterium]|nr:hypothetical protein [Hyphomicrobiaceae bacterium]
EAIAALMSLTEAAFLYVRALPAALAHRGKRLLQALTPFGPAKLHPYAPRRSGMWRGSAGRRSSCNLVKRFPAATRP